LDIIGRGLPVQSLEERHVHHLHARELNLRGGVLKYCTDAELQLVRVLIVAEQPQSGVGPAAAGAFIQVVQHAYDDDARLAIADKALHVPRRLVTEQRHKVMQPRR